jgi:hypothetical protein
MQHPQDDDALLRGLLQEWKAPETPASLEQRVLGSLGPAAPSAPRERQREPWWRFLVNGYIRVPVPVACALVALLTFAAWRVADQPPGPCVSERAAASASGRSQPLPSNRCEHPAPGVC